MTNALAERILRRFREPDLDPAWVEEMRREYDERAGYRDYHAYCRSRFGRELASGRSPLLDQGRKHLRVLSPEEAGDLRRRIERRFVCDATKRKGREKIVYGRLVFIGLS